MSKEKKRNTDEVEKKETLFYYEIIGVVLIIFSVTILGKFGKIGNFFTIIFKTFFGDWYWFFVLFILFLGLYSLFLHKKFDFKSNVFIGFCFISLTILILSHFPLHNYANNSSKNYFSSIWDVYKNYIDYQESTYLGGGIIGALFFYAIFYMFGKFGVILISILIFLLGISLFINKPVLDMFKFFTSKVKYIKKYTGNFTSFFKYELGSSKGKVKKDKNNIFLKNVSVPIRLFDANKTDTSIAMQEKISNENKNLILTVLNSQNIEYKFIKMNISYKITTYKVLLYSYTDIKQLINKLQEVISDNFFYSKENGVLTLQITNQYEQLLTIKEVLLKQNSLMNNYILPLGVSSDEELIEIDLAKKPNFILIGSENSGIKNTVNSIIMTLFTKVLINNFSLKIFDIYNDFEKYNEVINISHGNILDFLDEIISEIDERITIFQKFNIYNFTEYNRKIEMGLINETFMKRMIVVVNHINMDKETFSFFENKIMYVNQSSVKVGINIFFIARNSNIINNVVMSLFENKMFFKCDSERFNKNIIKNDNCYYLLDNGDVLLTYDNETFRLQIPLITLSELDNAIKFLAK